MDGDRRIETAFGPVAVSDAGAGEAALFLIHGNSSLKEVFAPTVAAFRSRWRVVAMDLPGHGASPDAADPEAVYTIPGYARVAQAVIAALGLKPVAVFGWSLGGHIGLEMVAQEADLAGLAICGTPPVTFSGPLAGRGFLPSPELSLAGQEVFSEQDCLAYGAATVGGAQHLTPALLAGVRRTHGLARRTMFSGILARELADEKELVERMRVPLAIIDGADDVFLDHDYVETGPAYASLWEGRRHVIPGAGHAPFLTHAGLFNAHLGRFLEQVLG